MIDYNDPVFGEDFVEEVLFAGGSWDGVWKYVNTRIEFMKVAITPDVLIDISDSYTPRSSITYVEEVYRRTRYKHPIRRYEYVQYEIV